MAGEMTTCFECLQRRIESDLSTDVLFRYGISSSALPFGSTAVVRVCFSREDNNEHRQEFFPEFMLTDISNVPYISNLGETHELGKFMSEFDWSQSHYSSGTSGEFDSPRSLNYNSEDVDVDLEDSTNKPHRKQSYLKVISMLSPLVCKVRDPNTILHDLVYKFISHSSEDYVTFSLNRLIDGKSGGECGATFLSSVGCPVFSERNIHCHVRHPNISPITTVLKTSAGHSYFLQPVVPYTLENILQYSLKALMSDWDIRFLMYQILSALSWFHGLGIGYGNLCPSNIFLNDSNWVWMNMVPVLSLDSNIKETGKSYRCSVENCPCQALYSDLKLSTSVKWHTDFERWWNGYLTNFEYLLALNKLAGRRWGDHTFHTVMPWVIDFSVKPDENCEAGWRNLKKSKWRLAKGDEQLDFTYLTSEVPHHISEECLSELAVCSYKARRLPLGILRSAVRSVYEPNEYPSNMQRLYQWTPDECIPEFYSDPRVFKSLHSGMIDLGIPSWASSPEEFILLHRNALESERVSQNIHHWIDITFGYKLSGEASIAAKNVMLPPSDPLKPRSSGRRQLFTSPHPIRKKVKSYTGSQHCISMENAIESACLENLEEAASFCEHARILAPTYNFDKQSAVEYSSFALTNEEQFSTENSESPHFGSFTASDDLNHFFEYFEAEDGDLMGFQDLLLWRHRPFTPGILSEDNGEDIFSFGCILAEVYLKRPLFNPATLISYKEGGALPGHIQELPFRVSLLVEACIKREWIRRPSAKCLLDSPYFPPTVKSAYVFLSPLQLISSNGDRLAYTAKLASKGVLRAMGAFSAEMCVPYCLHLVLSPLTDLESEMAISLINEFLKSLSYQAIETLVLPTIQKILQGGSDKLHLKVSILQDSFVRHLWSRVGKQLYFEKMHSLVLANLCSFPNKIITSSASVLLIGSCEELGIPITIHQTLLPLIHSFGKGLSADRIETLVRIGGILGENFMVRQLIPLLKNVAISTTEASCTKKPDLQLNFISSILIDSLSTLDGLLSYLPAELISRELIQDQVLIHIKVLAQPYLDLPVIQVAAMTLISVCQKVGSDHTTLYVMPHLKELFSELAFSQMVTSKPHIFRKDVTDPLSKIKSGQIESRMDLVLFLYPSLAALLGIDQLRQSCSTCYLLEQILERYYNWKWESYNEFSSYRDENVNTQRSILAKISSEYNPTNLLANGIGWSVTQSQGVRCSMTMAIPRQSDEILHKIQPNPGIHEPWFWFPPTSWVDSDSLWLGVGLKEDIPWKIQAAVLHSARAHPGALRSLAISRDECTVYTGGSGPGFKGSVQKWELSRMNCVSGYYGHDEFVNSVQVLSLTGRVASCDGIIHVWHGQTGKLVMRYSEPSTNPPHSSSASTDQSNILTPGMISGGILSNAFSSSSYTCMQHLEYNDTIVAGLGNGSIRFIDIVQNKKLHLWKSDTSEFSFSSLVSAICACDSGKQQEERDSAPASWIAAGLSSGFCRLLDARGGTIISDWRAHDGYITKLAAVDEHILLSSSLDKTLRVWDLRRNLASQCNVIKGHLDGILSFALWGRDVISVAKHNIGLTSLGGSTEGVIQSTQPFSPQRLYAVDRTSKNVSVLSAITILPFSRLFLVGTEDGYLKICC